MTLLAATDPEPTVAENAGSRAPWLLVCDHAGRMTPSALGGLGLPEEDWDRHIAWDIGALALAQMMAARLGDVCLIHQRYSRLVIDCNRDPARADAIVAVADGADIPANRDVSAEARAARITEIHAPYHAAISAKLDSLTARGQRPALVLIHSFTPVLNGRRRPWQAGVLHLGNPLSLAALAWLRAHSGLEIGDNAPYAMDEIDYTAPFHAGRRGLEYLELETRQDLISNSEGQQRFAALYARMLKVICLEEKDNLQP